MNRLDLLSQIQSLLDELYNLPLSLDEVHEMTGISKSKLYRMREERKVLTFKPDEGKIFFDRRSLKKWMEQNPRETNDVIDFTAANHKKKLA